MSEDTIVLAGLEELLWSRGWAGKSAKPPTPHWTTPTTDGAPAPIVTSVKVRKLEMNHHCVSASSQLVPRVLPSLPTAHSPQSSQQERTTRSLHSSA